MLVNIGVEQRQVGHVLLWCQIEVDFGIPSSLHDWPSCVAEHEYALIEGLLAARVIKADLIPLQHELRQALLQAIMPSEAATLQPDSSPWLAAEGRQWCMSETRITCLQLSCQLLSTLHYCLVILGNDASHKGHMRSKLGAAVSLG